MSEGEAWPGRQSRQAEEQRWAEPAWAQRQRGGEQQAADAGAAVPMATYAGECNKCANVAVLAGDSSACFHVTFLRVGAEPCTSPGYQGCRVLPLRKPAQVTGTF